MYIYTKVEMPMEVEDLICDVFDLIRPKLKVLDSYQEAVEAVNRISLVQKLNQPVNLVQNVEGVAFESNSDSANEEEYDSIEAEESIEEEDVEPLVTQESIEADAEEAAFTAEYAQLMNDSLDSRKFEKKQSGFDIPLPIKSKTGASGITVNDSDRVVFSVLTKKGNKQQIKTVELPASSSFVVNTQNKLVAEHLERMQLKKIVLDYEREYSDDPVVPAPIPVLKQSQRVRRLGDNSSSALFEPRGYYSYALFLILFVILVGERSSLRNIT